MSRKGTVGTVILTAVLVEAALLLRLWLQATSKPLDGYWASLVVVLSDALSAPFMALTATPPLERSGVVDFTVLVALEGYFCVAVGLLILAGGLNYIAPWLLGQSGRLPDYILEAEDSQQIRIWQRVRGTGRPFLTIVPQHRQPVSQDDHGLHVPWGSGDPYEP